MQSLHKRLDPYKPKVLMVTETFGQFRAMTEFDVADYIAFRHWLKEVTGDDNFGHNPKIRLDGSQTLGDQLVDAFLRKVAHLETENERLKQRMSCLEWELSKDNGKETQKALAILEVCQV